jgi:hypothetical protein
MSEPKDPERLLADALRAQAVFAPQPERPPVAPVDPPTTDIPLNPAAQTSGTEGLPPQYGLLSGAGADSLERERAALDSATGSASRPVVPAGVLDPPTVRTGSIQPTSVPLPVHWVLLLAILLGLAAGSVIGLLTLL